MTSFRDMALSAMNIAEKDGIDITSAAKKVLRINLKKCSQKNLSAIKVQIGNLAAEEAAAEIWYQKHRQEETSRHRKISKATVSAEDDQLPF